MSPEIQQSVRDHWREDLRSGRVFTENGVMPEDIVSAVCRAGNVTEAELTGSRKNGDIVLARQVAIYLLGRWCPHYSEAALRRLFRRDHTTINYTRNIVQKRLDEGHIPTAKLLVDSMALARGISEGMEYGT